MSTSFSHHFTTTSTPLAARLPPRAPAIDIQRDRYTSVIQVERWTITATKKPILNIKEVEAAEKSLSMPLPEMTFGNNHLILTYNPSSFTSTTSLADASDSSSGPSKSGGKVQISWNALDALEEVGVGEGWEESVGGGVQVSMAEKWGKNRSNPSALLTDVPLPTTPVKPHDWTYSTIHTGSMAGPSRFQPTAQHEIPMNLLARQDPILDRIMFYEDVPLFEDELHDNGESILNARIRIMPHSFFILARLFLRVDNVLFRMFDVRVYHAFGSGEVIREVSGMEAEYDDVKAMLEKPSDLSPLTDPNFVHRAMTHLCTRPESDQRSTRSGKPWPGLGRRMEVLKLPALGVDQATDAVEAMSI